MNAVPIQIVNAFEKALLAVPALAYIPGLMSQGRRRDHLTGIKCAERHARDNWTRITPAEQATLKRVMDAGEALREWYTDEVEGRHE